MRRGSIVKIKTLGPDFLGLNPGSATRGLCDLGGYLTFRYLRIINFEMG